MPEPEYISPEEHHTRTVSSQQRRQTGGWGRPVYLAIVVVVLCGLSFVGGENYQKHHAKSVSTASTAVGPGRAGGGGFARRGGFGQVTAVSSSSITVQNLRTSATTTYSVTSSTTVTNNGQTASITDIKTGDTVAVMPANSGSTTAATIVLNPSFGGQGSGQSNPGSSQTN